MLHFHSLEELHLQNSWVTIGAYDGVHKGHQAILSGLTQSAHRAGAPAVMVTFFPHPSVVLRGQASPLYLTTPEEKAHLAGLCGIDYVVTLEFTRQFAALPASDFVARLQEALGMRRLWVGFNFAMGRNLEGDIPTLRRLAEVRGFTLKVFDPITLDGETISSSLVRAALTSGDCLQAARLLGRFYSISGRVVPGDGRGKLIGVPTANLDFWPEKVLPSYGVYGGSVLLDGQRLLGAANLGIRPTFETNDLRPRLEVYILDLDADLYGREVRFHFIRRLRGEEKYGTVEALVAQMNLDIAAARALGGEPLPEGVAEPLEIQE